MLKRLFLALALTLTAAVAITPAAAQLGGSSGVNFLTAVRERDGGKATSLLDASGSTVLNYKDDRGDGAVHILARSRDLTWLGFILGRGADANLQNKTGETPLIAAARIGWLEGTDLMLRGGATPDLTNRLGETALIIAVQQRQLPVVRRLLEAGADPDKRDSASGRNARDYAKLADRGGDITRVLQNTLGKAPKRAIAGPKL